MAQQSRQRRKGVRPHRTLWTPEAVALIDAYQEQHQLPSFSVAAETLVRLGLQQSPTEIITPIIASAVQHAIHRELDRLIRIQIYTAIDAGMAYRFAAAATRDVGRLKGDPPKRYQEIKATIRADTRRRIARGEMGQILDELAQDEALLTDDGEGEHGDRESKLSRTRPEDAPSGQTGSPVLHVS